MLASYHNHTTWSDGASSVAELVAHATTLGLGEVGISDHLTLHPTRRDVAWSMPRDALPQYVSDVQAAAAETGGPAVRLGLEVDWFEAQAATLDETLAALPLDFVIGSIHFFEETELDWRAEIWRRWSPQQRDEVHREYWRQIATMAASGLFDVVGHLDLTKKFGFRPRGDLGELIDEALDAIAAAGMVVEINTDGLHRPCREPYPSVALLKACRRRQIPVTISADAHRPEHLLRDFVTAADCLIEAGYDEVARFAGREIRFEAIASAVPRS